MFKAVGRSLGQLSHSLPSGGPRWCHWGSAGLERRIAQAHVLTTSKWGAAPPASSPTLLATLPSGSDGWHQSSLESPMKCQQLRFYRWVIGLSVCLFVRVYPLSQISHIGEELLCLHDCFICLLYIPCFYEGNFTSLCSFNRCFFSAFFHVRFFLHYK